MLRKTTLAIVPLLAIALALSSDTSTASADGFAIQVGRFGISTYNHRGHNHRYNSFRTPVYRNYGPSYGSYYRGGYHGYARPHLDWHGPSLVPHGNHYDYVPGHWDVHYGRHHGHH